VGFGTALPLESNNNGAFCSIFERGSKNDYIFDVMNKGGERMEKSASKKMIDWPVLVISGGFLVFFVMGSLINGEVVSNWVDQSFGFSIEYFGSLYQFLVLAYFFVAL